MGEEILHSLKGGLIVSCQALEDEPLYSSYIMSKMAYAAKEGGAVGIRANTTADINAIRQAVRLPVIGIVKREYAGSEVYITPTIKEVDELASCGVEIIALDATSRPRPGGETLYVFFKRIREKYPNQLFMADCSTYEEGLEASLMGFDLIGTTLSGYTQETKGKELPNLDLIKQLSKDLNKPVIGEGGIWTPEQLKAAFSAGAFAAVIGSAITRPRDITRYFISGSGCRSGSEIR